MSLLTRLQFPFPSSFPFADFTELHTGGADSVVQGAAVVGSTYRDPTKHAPGLKAPTSLGNLGGWFWGRFFSWISSRSRDVQTSLC